MNRRDFLKATVAAGTLTKLGDMAEAVGGGRKHPLKRRALGKTGETLSVVGFGGIVVTNVEQADADRIVAEAVDRGVNYFDVAPSYGNAEERLGPALEPYRSKVFLACKTGRRDKQGAEEELRSSLKRLRTDHVDLYQLHGLTEIKDLDQALGTNGAMEAFVAARKEGLLRFIGFSAHSVQVALAAMDRFDFDAVLFPVNYVLYYKANFGPQVVKRANEKGMGVLCLKAMAHQQWPKDANRQEYPKCWYQPITDPKEASLAVRFTLSEKVTALLPPGDERLWRMAVEAGEEFKPVNAEEREVLRQNAEGLEPIFKEV